MRSSDWSSDVCSSDLRVVHHPHAALAAPVEVPADAHGIAPARIVVDDDVADQVRILAPEIGRPAGLLRFAVGPDQLDLPVAIRRVALDPVVLDLGALMAHAPPDPPGRAVAVVFPYAAEPTRV